MNYSEACRRFIDTVRSRGLFVEGLAVANADEILFEHYFAPKKERNIYSHTKSFIATAAGIAIDEGKLSLTDRPADFFPEKLPSDCGKYIKEITLHDLLCMSSGFGVQLLMGEGRRAGEGYPDYIAYMFSKPVRQKPGTEFTYSNGDTYLAARMVEKAVGKPMQQYLYEKILRPLGIRYPVMDTDPQGHVFGGTGLYLDLSEMIKLGMLYLGGGVYKGQRIVSQKWIGLATQKQIDCAPDDPDPWHVGYGYQFWLSPFPQAYRADGAYGQITTVLPQKGLAVSVQCPEHGDYSKVKPVLHNLIFEIMN